MRHTEKCKTIKRINMITYVLLNKGLQKHKDNSKNSKIS